MIVNFAGYDSSGQVVVFAPLLYILMVLFVEVSSTKIDWRQPWEKSLLFWAFANHEGPHDGLTL